LGPRFLAGEKCCCKVENAGFLICDSARRGFEFDIPSPDIPRDGGRSVVDEFNNVEDDRVRTWPRPRVPAALERELADGFRRCRDCVRGGLERSALTGSVLEPVAAFETRFEDDLCSPPVAGLLILARAGGGRIEELEVTLSVALGGLA